MKKTLLISIILMLTNHSFAQLGGVKTVSANGGDYLTLQTAIKDLNLQGVGNGGVTFELKAGEVYTVDNSTDSLVITASGSAENPIAFKSTGEGNKPLIEATGSPVINGDAIIKFLGSDYTSIDGITFSGDKNIENGLYYASLQTNNGCQYNNVRNCSIKLDLANTNPTNGIYTYSPLPSTPNGTNSFNKFLSNRVENCRIGYYLRNTTADAPSFDCDNEVSGTDKDSSIVTNLQACGIYLYGQAGSKIHHNQISNIFATTASPAGISAASTNPSGEITGVYEIHNNTISNIFASEASVFGIYFSQRKTTANIYSNVVSGVKTPSATSVTANGIAVIATNLVANIYNNLIYDIQAPASNTNPATRGFDCRTASQFNVYYNTVYLKYEATGAVNRSVCFALGGVPCDLQNNIFVNQGSLPVGATNAFTAAFYKNTPTSLSDILSTSDRNLYYTDYQDYQHPIFYGHHSTSPLFLRNITEYQAALKPREEHSISIMPKFESLKPDSMNFRLSDDLPVYAQPITTPLSITTDLAGNKRDNAKPTLGAYERTSSAIDDKVITKELSLKSYPNPFNLQTQINYSINTEGLVKVSVYNSLGQIVKELYAGVQSRGVYNLNFDASGLNSGVYYCRLQTGEQSIVSKMLFCK